MFDRVSADVFRRVECKRRRRKNRPFEADESPAGPGPGLVVLVLLH